MKFVLRYMALYKKQSILAPIFKMLEAAFELLVPFVVAEVIDNGINARDEGYIVKMILVMLAFAVVGAISAVTAQYFAASAATGVAADIRKDLNNKVINMDKKRYRSLGVSTLITRMTSDVNAVQNAVNMFLRLFLRSPFIVAGAFIMSVIISPRMSLIIGGVIVVLAIVIAVVMKITLPRISRIQSKLDSLIVSIRNNYFGAKVIRGFLIQDKEVEKFHGELEDIRTSQLKVGRRSNILNPITFALVNLGIVLVLYFGGGNVYTGELTTGEVVALLNYMSQILIELVKLANLIVILMKGIPSANRIEEIIEGDSEAETEAPIVLSVRSIVDNELKGIGKGEKIGIIGPTGSGKSLLLSEYMQGVRDKSKVGYVPQEDTFFTGSIAENILLKDFDGEDISYALKMSCFQEVVDVKGGENTLLERNADNLSTGQRKRLALARALNKRPDVLLMDDVTNPLDMITEKEVISNVLDSDMAVVIASQKPSAVMRADTIIVIDGGKILDKGSHEELLEKCSLYEKMFYAQFPERRAYV